MHGIVHAELRDYAAARVGEARWSELLGAAGLGGRVFLPSRTYPDEELTALLVALGAATGDPLRELLSDFGRSCVPGLLRTYGTFLEPGWRTLDVVENTEEVIHRTVRLQSPGADPPRLSAARPGAGEVRVRYESPRRLCDFAVGLVRGIASHFGERVEIDQPACMHQGDPHCEIVVRAAAPP